MESQADNIENIPESRAARWAWRVSLIPLLGVPLFIALAFLTLYRIGSKGRTGIWLLRRGVISIFLINIGLYFGLYLAGYSGYIPSIYDRCYRYLPKHGIINIRIASVNNSSTLEYQQWFFGKKHGRWYWYNKNGDLHKDGEYRDDLENGVWTYYTDDRKTSISGPYKDGKRNGHWIFCRPNGSKDFEGDFDDDNKYGVWTYWYENGNKSEEGLLAGNLNENMEIAPEDDYRYGFRGGDWTYYYPSGKVKERGEYLSGSYCSTITCGRIGVWTEWYESGPKKYENNYDSKVQKYWYENGKYEAEYQEQSTPHIVKWKSWYDTGEKQSEAILKPAGGEGGDGDYWYWQGEYLTFYKSGKRKTSGLIICSSLNDHPADGKTIVTKTRDKRLKWQYWDESGNLVREETYDDTGKLISTEDYTTTTTAPIPHPFASPIPEGKSK